MVTRNMWRGTFALAMIGAMLNLSVLVDRFDWIALAGLACACYAGWSSASVLSKPGAAAATKPHDAATD